MGVGHSLEVSNILVVNVLPCMLLMTMQMIGSQGMQVKDICYRGASSGLLMSRCRHFSSSF